MPNSPSFDCSANQDDTAARLDAIFAQVRHCSPSDFQNRISEIDRLLENGRFVEIDEASPGSTGY